MSKQKKQAKNKLELRYCKRCGGQAEVRCVRIGDFWYRFRFHLHSKVYYVLCTKCHAKTTVHYSEKKAIKDWNNRR